MREGDGGTDRLVELVKFLCEGRGVAVHLEVEAAVSFCQARRRRQSAAINWSPRTRSRGPTGFQRAMYSASRRRKSWLFSLRRTTTLVWMP